MALAALLIVGIALQAFQHLSAAEAADSPRQLQQIQQVNPQTFLGTWRDDQNRFWFTIDEIVGGEVRDAQFWLAHLKEGHIDGDSIVLTSESCVPFIGCYEYAHVAKLVGPDSMDMRGYSNTCAFGHGCREEGDVVNHVLTRD
jgi:hypothetical protein